MQYAANEAKKQNALDQLKAAQDKSTAQEKAISAAQAINDRYKKYNDQLITHGYSHAGDEQYIGKDLGGSGNSGGSSGSSGVKKNTSTSKGSFSGLFGNSVQQPVVPVTPIEPDTTVEDSYKASMEAANERLKQAYEYQQGLLSKAKDNAMREAYIKQQMVERAYPEQLTAAGINGGATEALIARNNADYANQRTAAQGDYMKGLAEAGYNYQQGVLQNNQNFLEIMAAYRQGLDEMRRKWELEQLEKSGLLKMTNNRYGTSYLGQPQMTAQEYLNNLRQNYGNLFK